MGKINRNKPQGDNYDQPFGKNHYLVIIMNAFGFTRKLIFLEDKILERKKYIHVQRNQLLRIIRIFLIRSEYKA